MIYTNPAYIIPYGDKDYFELSIEVEIERDGSAYSARVLSLELSSSMEFASLFFNNLTENKRTALAEQMRTMLLADMEPNLYDYYKQHGTIDPQPV